MSKSIIPIALGLTSVLAVAAAVAVEHVNQPDHILHIGQAENRADMIRICKYYNDKDIVIQHDIPAEKISVLFNTFNNKIFGQPEVIELTPDLKQRVAGHCPSIK